MYEYKTEESDNSSLFYFTNNSGNDFSVEVVDSLFEVEEKLALYAVSIDCLNEKNPKYDDNIGLTVCYIINQYLSQNPDIILIYICDSIDHRAHVRDRKFSYWYKRYNSNKNHQLLKFKYDIDMGGFILEHFTSAAFDNERYTEEEITEIFSNYTSDMTRQKTN